jgi:hypothetical protein
VVRLRYENTAVTLGWVDSGGILILGGYYWYDHARSLNHGSSLFPTSHSSSTASNVIPPIATKKGTVAQQNIDPSPQTNMSASSSNTTCEEDKQTKSHEGLTFTYTSCGKELVVMDSQETLMDLKITSIPSFDFTEGDPSISEESYIFYDLPIEGPIYNRSSATINFGVINWVNSGTGSIEGAIFSYNLNTKTVSLVDIQSSN